MRAHLRPLVAAAALLAVALPAGARADAGTTPVTSRAFTAEVSATPFELLFGRNETEIGGGWFASRAAVSNPPADGYARASLVELGLIEALREEPPPSAVSDTGTSDLGGDGALDVGASRFRTHADESPAALATTTGVEQDAGGIDIGALSSVAAVEAGGDAVVASVEARLGSVTGDALHIGSVVYRATARADGSHASGDGTVELVDATFAGVPVTIGPDGASVDSTEVPYAQLDAARRAFTAAFSSSPYAELRLVQPVTEIAPDGSHIRVHGGGLFARFTNAEPGNAYFGQVRLVSGEIDILVGEELPAAQPPERPLVGSDDPCPSCGPAEPSGAPGPAGGAAAAPTERPDAAAAGPRLDRIAADDRLRLAGTWRGLPWALGALWAVAGAVLACALLPPFAPVRRRVMARTSRLADQYWRG